MALVLTNLERAIGSLESALAQPKDEFIRDSVIQRFEYTYEAAWKSMRRALVFELGVPESGSRRELFRLAAQNGLIDDPIEWFGFHEARNSTSHVYDEEVAEEVYEAAGRFVPPVRRLLSVLRQFGSGTIA